MYSPVTILIDPLRAHPLVWIHRAEARAIVNELRAMGREVHVESFDPTRLPRRPPPLLRLSDPVMLRATRTLGAAGIDYHGPGAAALARCYDKWSAYQTVAAAGIDCPETRLADETDTLTRPVVIKPRQGSDSIGLRVLIEGAAPVRARNERTLVQEQVIGTEITIGVMGAAVGAPLRLLLPEGVPHTFLRKYLLRPRHEALAETDLVDRVRETALRIASALGADWAVRVDFILERSTGRLVFLECDAAPLAGPASAFAESLAASGMMRAVQLAQLLGEG